MKKPANYLRAAGLVSLVMGLLSQDSFAQEARDITGAEEDTIRSLEEQERMGVLDQDLEALEQIWSEGYMVNSPFNQVAPEKSVVLDIFREGLAQYSSFDQRIEHLRVTGDIAIVMGAETVQPIGNAPRAGETVERRFTHVWERDGATWRLIGRHANNVAPD